MRLFNAFAIIFCMCNALQAQERFMRLELLAGRGQNLLLNTSDLLEQNEPRLKNLSRGAAIEADVALQFPRSFMGIGFTRSGYVATSHLGSDKDQLASAFWTINLSTRHRFAQDKHYFFFETGLGRGFSYLESNENGKLFKYALTGIAWNTRAGVNLRLYKSLYFTSALSYLHINSRKEGSDPASNRTNLMDFHFYENRVELKVGLALHLFKLKD